MFCNGYFSKQGVNAFKDSTRNAHNYSKCRLELHESSFVLNFVDEWNALNFNGSLKNPTKYG